MLFNSFDFALFLPVVFVLYWFATARSLRLQNALITAASYVFYGWWDWRFLSLIVFSTLVDFGTGLLMSSQRSKSVRKVLLSMSIITNLGLLGFFKYYNFFMDSLVDAFTLFGQPLSVSSLNIVLPVGISFYTFQTMSYSIDIYRNKITPSRDFIAFSAFVCFFPQLVAGPIERAANLLPQFTKPRQFVYAEAVDGMRQILWGLFKKMVIADQCAIHVNHIFGSSDEFSGAILFLGATLFAFQIYGDFSGYSDIAIGTARLFGFRLMQNFAFPYFSRDIAEFWRRWHISLSTWFRDYLYIPLGGSFGGRWQTVRNTFAIFLISGLWHGPNWTFVAWGTLHSMFFLPLLLQGKNRKNLDTVAQFKSLPSFREAIMMLQTFIIITIAWIFFRADSITHALSYMSEMLSGLFSRSSYVLLYNYTYWEVGISLPLTLFLMLAVEWYGRTSENALDSLMKSLGQTGRVFTYYTIVLMLMWFSQHEQEFIYFQF